LYNKKGFIDPGKVAIVNVIIENVNFGWEIPGILFKKMENMVA
jgi:hypothetical protein